MKLERAIRTVPTALRQCPGDREVMKLACRAAGQLVSFCVRRQCVRMLAYMNLPVFLKKIR